jgi:hypothetical protein
MNTNKSKWFAGLPLGAAVVFCAMSQAEPATASTFSGSIGTLQPLNPGIIIRDDAMQDVADAMNQAARDELQRQSRTPSIDPTLGGSIFTASGQLFH